MKNSKTIKNILTSSCVLFSIIVIIYSLILMIFGGGLGLDPFSVFLLFPFSGTVIFANNILKYRNLNNLIKSFMHFLLVTCATIIFIYIPHSASVSPKSAMILFLCYSVLYFLWFFIYKKIIKRKSKKNEKDSEYRNVYNKTI